MNMHRELDELSRVLAEEICRARHDSPERFQLWVENCVRHALHRIDAKVDSIAARSIPGSPICGYTATGRARHRAQYIRSETGFGFGCDVCGGCHNDIATDLTLRLGSHKFSVTVDLCRECALRVVETIEARLFDGRRKQ